MQKRQKRLISIIVLTAFMLSIGAPALAAGYRDVSADCWQADGIAYVTEHGIMGGTGEGVFAPNQTLTRAQIVEILYRLEGCPAVNYSGQFQDVPETAWFARSVSWASQQKVVNGTAPNTFAPTANITREQLAAIIGNYVQKKGIPLQVADNLGWGAKDSWSVSRYAQESVQLVWQSGIMNNDSQYNFNPQKTVSRADAAVIFMRLHKAMNGERLTVVIPNTTPDYSAMTKAEKDALGLDVAQRIAAYIPKDASDAERVSLAASIVSYYCSFCTYTMEGKDYRTPFGVFVKGEYSCAGATRALGQVLTCMGYEWKHVNENQYTHQWCELYMDGQLGWADGQTGRIGFGARQL